MCRLCRSDLGRRTAPLTATSRREVDHENLHGVWSRVRTVESTPSVPRVSCANHLCLRPPEAGQVGAVRDLPQRGEGVERELERWPNEAQGRVRDEASAGHPRVRRSPYVFEQILIAEELLGRYLRRGESVHHRNGVRDDNRPENLELWTTPQPSGIRASDAVEWAIQVLDRYTDWGRGAPPTVLPRARALLEVAGVEPASPETLEGLLRAQPG